MELPDPFVFVRVVTFTLATVWTVRGALRTRAFIQRWGARFDRWGVERGFLRRAVFVFLARVTVLDPTNLALLLLLGALWTLRPGP